jgi:outer membrane immunogenic protein
MKKLLLGAVALLTFVGTAGAADLPLKAPPAPPPVVTPSWYGFWIGAQAGYGWGGEAINFTPDAAFAPAFAAGTVPGSLAGDPRGALGGIQFGSNWQFGRWVIGTASDFSFSDIERSQTVSAAVVGLGTVTSTGHQKLSWLSTTRGRLGYTVTDNLLLFGSAGLADGRASASSVFAAAGCPGVGDCPAGSNDKTLWGWAAGAGAEYAVGHWSVDVEYLHYDLGNLNYNMVDPTAPTAFIGASTKFSGDIVRGGINYRFDWTPWDFLFGHHS